MSQENKNKKGKADKPTVNGMSLKAKNFELIFSLTENLVSIVVRQPKQKNKKLIITAVDWMLINKSMFNPNDYKRAVEEKASKGNSPAIK